MVTLPPSPKGWDPTRTHTGMAARRPRVAREFCAGCWGAGRIRADGAWHRCQWCGGDGSTLIIHAPRDAT